MKKLPHLFAVALLAVLALNSATSQAQTYPPIMDPVLKKRTPAPQPAPLPLPSPTPAPVEARPDIITTTTTTTTSAPATAYRKGHKGHPHGMPPGQAKKYGYAANPSNGGLPPGQAKKAYRGPAPVPGTVQVREEKHSYKKAHKGKGR